MKKTVCITIVLLFCFISSVKAEPFKLEFTRKLPQSLSDYYSGVMLWHTGGEFEFSYVSEELFNLWKESLYEFVAGEDLCHDPIRCPIIVRSRIVIKKKLSSERKEVIEEIVFRFIIKSGHKMYEGIYMNNYQGPDNGKSFKYQDGEWIEHGRGKDSFNRIEKLAAGLWDFHKMIKAKEQRELKKYKYRKELEI
ncbi:hypothetical protein ACFL3E_00940 [Patescibacteria group bacterium]